MSSNTSEQHIKKPLLLAIDQGTTSTRAILFKQTGEITDLAQQELTLYYPQDGWVEQDAKQIWEDTLSVCNRVLRSSDGKNQDAIEEVVSVGITNQRETTIVWDKHTGKPIYNAIVWQDRRTAKYCETLKESTDEAAIAEKTGLLLDPYFCATKIRWILDHIEGAQQRAVDGDLLFGTVDCYLLWQLTAGKVHATDATNASRTLLFDIHRQCWDEDLIALFNIPAAMLPEVKDNTAHFGDSDPSFFGASLPINAMIGDQQSALVGQGCFGEGTLKSTYGTGGFMLMNTGKQAIHSRNRLLTTTAYRIAGSAHYAVEGSIFIAGAAIQWLRDGLKIIDSAAQSEVLAASVNDSGGVYFVPAFTGLGAPYWRADARGMIVGITRDTTAAHITRAALEAQAYQTRDVVEAMVADGGQAPTVLRVDGGLVANSLACQMLADILQTIVEVPKITEATAWGAASLSGLQAGIYGSFDDIANCWQCKQRFSPAMSVGQVNNMYAGWQQAVKRLL